MKIRIADKDEISEVDIEETRDAEAAGLIKEASPEEFRDHILGCKEVVMSQQVMDFLKREGVTPDDLVAMLLKSANATQ